MTQVVVDASVSMALVLTMPWSRQAANRVGAWQSEMVGIYAPQLWEYEVVSGLRKAVAIGTLNAQDAPTALEILMQTAVRRIVPDQDLHQAALRWATRLNQIVAYDAQYLALAEQLGAEFWTADRRLAERAHECGADWVHLITEGSDVSSSGGPNG